MRVHDSGMCLVAAHLSSGQAEGDELRRNYDYAEARARLAVIAPCPCFDVPGSPRTINKTLLSTRFEPWPRAVSLEPWPRAVSLQRGQQL